MHETPGSTFGEADRLRHASPQTPNSTLGASDRLRRASPQTTLGPYEIVIELAAGGMATTYIAHKGGDTFFARLVVVKRIHPWLLEDPKSGDMLREEARLGAVIQHPHVVHVEDVTTNDGEVCLVMPYVESLSLGALLKAARQSNERIPPMVASRIMLDVLSGLDAAHDAKDLRGQPLEIVHRDVSPNNVLVGADGRSRIIDFGIARAASRLSQTQSGDVKGTIAYMSPEQLRRRELDRRADVFAAGAVFYEMLTGERLFDGRDEADILIGVLADEIPSVLIKCPDVGQEVDAVLERALSREREERFSSARAFAEALEAVITPAAATDVATFVHRFGAAEFTRRREAIRDFVDRHTNDAASPSEVRPDATAAADPNLQSQTKRRKQRMAMGFGLVAGAVLIMGAFSRSRSDSSNSVAREETSVSAAKPIDTAAVAEMPRTISSPTSPPPIEPGLTRPPEIPSAIHSVSTPPRRPLPLREKVDKRRPSELQENPYR